MVDPLSMTDMMRDRAATKFRISSQFLAWTVLNFIVLSCLLSWISREQMGLDMQWQIRAGILRDVVREYPIGRQALVCSLWVMPLPTVAALIFCPFVYPQAYGLAYLYGLAFVTALAAVPLAALLKRLRVPLSRIVSTVLIAACAYAIGRTSYSDLLPCLAFLIIAVFFETHREPVLRALAGVFYGLALFSHVLGIVVAVVKVAGIVLSRIFARRDRQRLAIHWVQAIGLVYVFFVYLFLNWMIMRTPFWSLKSFDPRVPALCDQEAAEELLLTLRQRYPSSAPVVSGHWGYTIEPILKATKGYHFIDFNRDKVSQWERRELILVVPKEENPLASLCDVRAALNRNPARILGYLFLSESRNWEFYLVVKSER